MKTKFLTVFGPMDGAYLPAPERLYHGAKMRFEEQADVDAGIFLNPKHAAKAVQIKTHCYELKEYCENGQTTFLWVGEGRTGFDAICRLMDSYKTKRNRT